MANSIVLPTPDPQAVLGAAKLFVKEVESKPTQAVALTTADYLTYATDVGEVGADREDKEYDFFHLDSTVKTPGKATIKDLQITEALQSTTLATRKAQFDQKKFVVAIFFDEDNTLQYGCYGYIKSWGGTFSNKDNCVVQYTLSVSDDNITATYPVAGE